MRRKIAGSKGKAGRPATGCVSQNKNFWRGLYTVRENGKSVRRRVSLGRVDLLSKEQARERLDGIMRQDEACRNAIEIITKADVIGSIAWELPENHCGSHSRGVVALLRVVSDLVERGFHPYQPASPVAPCDLLVLIHGWKVVRVEVKMAQVECGHIRCDISRNIGKFDILAAVTPDGKVHYTTTAQISDLIYPFRKKRSNDSVLAQSTGGSKCL